MKVGEQKNMNVNIKKLGQFASDLIKQAGVRLAQMQQNSISIEEKRSHSDLVTIADKDIEQFLVDHILKEYPNHGILCEEKTFDKELTDFDTVWVIDPIDGTTNFIHGFPFYGISIGIFHKGEGIIGLVYNPSTDELFYGQKGNGAYVNNKRMTIDKPVKENEALISTVTFWDDYKTKEKVHPAIIQLVKNTRGVRMVGGAAISLCEIAKGTFDAYIMPMLQPWDYAAGMIILQEAGGTLTTLRGESVAYTKGSSILATHPDLHKKLLQYFE